MTRNPKFLFGKTRTDKKRPYKFEVGDDVYIRFGECSLKGNSRLKISDRDCRYYYNNGVIYERDNEYKIETEYTINWVSEYGLNKEKWENE